MDQHQAQVEELTALRDAAAQYLWALREVFDQAQREYEAALKRLDDLRQDATYEVARQNERLRACYREAAMAAAEGGWVDCSAYEQRLHAAEQQLARIIRAETQLQRAVEQYRRRCHAYAGFLDADFGRGQEYLRQVIDNYSRFAQQQLMPTHLEDMLRFKKPFVSREPAAAKPLSGLGPRPRGGGIESSGGPESREAGSERRG